MNGTGSGWLVVGGLLLVGAGIVAAIASRYQQEPTTDLPTPNVDGRPDDAARAKSAQT